MSLCIPGVAAAALAVPQQANALVNPAQESYGGLGRNTGSAGSSPKSPTRASMEGCECRESCFPWHALLWHAMHAPSFVWQRILRHMAA